LSSVSVVSNALRLKFFKPVRMSKEALIVYSEETDALVNKESDTKNNNENGGNKMKKVLTVEGMSCGHCKAAVEKALKAVGGVENAVVDLQNKSAEVELNKEVDNDTLTKAVTDAGYEVTEVK